MTRDKIDPKARVWTVSLGPDGKLRWELDAKRLAMLDRCEVRLAA